MASSIRSNCRKIVAIGRNYADHIKELNNAAPKQPFFFLKPPSSILLPGQGPILRPSGVSLHYEVELGLVMGKGLRNLDPQDEETALSSIGGYLVSIDMTARNVQDEAKKKGLPWSIAKGFDTFLPVSSYIPKAKIPNPHKADLWLSLNDQLRQNDSTELMIFRIPRILSDISRVMSLEPGDIVLTGTPKGVGEVKTGDKLKAGIRVDGKDINEGAIDVTVADSPSAYKFGEW
ncbi:fumarylacetoacetate hydrolase domain-containing protein 1 [Xylona heveae TC161]|uniref:Fumarylacetoacetate hydrolase domain-containing protein 1 n=1 Tax=Xylona heveae (strain CBS 132557 / TC161) TaxID=1328760 RepID=A0A165J935_XYLHT|nr:fumarylacetoacetate hydrolase domain-containing protein 1 [Xylona heveae TC161]KZF25917.1 fumarylacetoacetate hydrolase domain-containing protein 1 [Xylona heveae TC161]